MCTVDLYVSTKTKAGMPAEELHQQLFPCKYPITFFSKGNGI
ncbi:hypothetical protein BAXH7_02721 [Bacillus amyloliquefaciens XH7]|nr:hypothetical protein LL3_02797 [Bacillus amyloliquefaciens LL3]AEK89847.1 hypothetical protein BAXH7_02721 [Bacillus amyloliquefaciens XH7]